MPVEETRTAEQIERDAREAADREIAETRQLFLQGKYPGLCSGARNGTCTHDPQHKL